MALVLVAFFAFVGANVAYDIVPADDNYTGVK